MTHAPSPCTRICRIDQASGHCLGCWRTLDEIVAWPSLSDAQKHIVLAALAKRLRVTDQSQDPAHGTP